MHQLIIDFKRAYYSVRMKVLYNILIEFGIPMKLVRLIEICLTETYNRVWVGKHLFDVPITNCLKQEMLYWNCFSTLLQNMPLGRLR